VQITRPGDSSFLPQDLVDRLEILKLNETLAAKGLRPARFLEILLGVSKASLSTDSFLSAASFQHTIKVLAGAAIASKEDPLYGLKENVIIGKLIPAGTAFDPERFAGQTQSEVVAGQEGDPHQLDMFENMADDEDEDLFGDEEDLEDLADSLGEDDEDSEFDE